MSFAPAPPAELPVVAPPGPPPELALQALEARKNGSRRRKKDPLVWDVLLEKVEKHMTSYEIHNPTY